MSTRTSCAVWCFLYLRGLISYEFTRASVLSSIPCVYASSLWSVTFGALVTRPFAAYMRLTSRGYRTLHRRRVRKSLFPFNFAMDIPSPTLTGLSDDDSWDSPTFSDHDTDLVLDFADEVHHSQSQSSNSSDDATSSALPSDVTLDFDCGSEYEVHCEDLDFDSDNDNTEPNCISRLEAFVEDFLTQLLAASKVLNDPKMTKVPKPITLQIADRSRKPKDCRGVAMRTLSFPPKARNLTSRPLAQFFRVIDLMHEALVTGIPTTKRDMFYKDTQLFKTQSVVNKLVDDVAATLGVGRAHLNVVRAEPRLHACASPKGMFCGTALQIHLHSEEIIFGTDTEGSLIPSAEDIAGFTVHEDLAWVLVVEKEAVFQTLAHLRFTSTSSIPGLGIVITGKGYPDLATSQLVALLSSSLPPSIPFLALVDADPYGIDIMSVYKYGSASMAHEHATSTAPTLRWVGLRSSELDRLGVDHGALIPITRHDEKKTMRMLTQRALPEEWRRELQYMLFRRKKAEIEVLSSVGEWALCHYLEFKVREAIADSSNV